MDHVGPLDALDEQANVYDAPVDVARVRRQAPFLGRGLGGREQNLQPRQELQLLSKLL